MDDPLLQRQHYNMTVDLTSSRNRGLRRPHRNHQDIPARTQPPDLFELFSSELGSVSAVPSNLEFEAAGIVLRRRRHLWHRLTSRKQNPGICLLKQE